MAIWAVARPMKMLTRHSKDSFSLGFPAPRSDCFPQSPKTHPSWALLDPIDYSIGGIQGYKKKKKRTKQRRTPLGEMTG